MKIKTKEVLLKMDPMNLLSICRTHVLFNLAIGLCIDFFFGGWGLRNITHALIGMSRKVCFRLVLATLMIIVVLNVKSCCEKCTMLGSIILRNKSVTSAKSFYYIFHCIYVIMKGCCRYYCIKIDKLVVCILRSKDKRVG